MNYEELYHASIEEKEIFWAKEAARLPWSVSPSKILSEDEMGHYRWFADGELNMSY